MLVRRQPVPLCCVHGSRKVSSAACACTGAPARTALVCRDRRQFHHILPSLRPHKTHRRRRRRRRRLAR